MTPVRGAGFIKQDTGVARDLEGHENLTESFEESCANWRRAKRIREVNESKIVSSPRTPYQW